MKKLFFVSCLMLSVVFAEDIVIKSAGTGADANGISLQNSDATELMIIEGDGDITVDSTTFFINATSNKVGLGTTDPTVQLHVIGTEGLLVQGNYESGTALNLGAGTRMHFYPKKAAFRVGLAYEDGWDDSNIGNYSFATGRRTVASDFYSIAMGYSTTASGSGAVATGQGTTASGDDSFATGYGTTASGGCSIATGSGTIASGVTSNAMGYDAEADGAISTAIGLQTKAKSYCEVALGAYTTDYTPESNYDWNTSDRLLVVGNGIYDWQRSDALILWKNGNMIIAGTLTENSDLRLKERIRPIDSALEKIMKLDGKYFYWNDVKPHDMEHEQVGLIAQEVQEVIPQLVKADQSEDAYLSLNYQGLVPVLINAVKEQQAMIESQQAQIDELTRVLAIKNEPVKKEGFFKRLFSGSLSKKKLRSEYTSNETENTGKDM